MVIQLRRRGGIGRIKLLLFLFATTSWRIKFATIWTKRDGFVTNGYLRYRLVTNGQPVVCFRSLLSARQLRFRNRNVLLRCVTKSGGWAESNRRLSNFLGRSRFYDYRSLPTSPKSDRAFSANISLIIRKNFSVSEFVRHFRLTL